MSKKFHILCIDDSRAVHAFLKSCLEEWALSITQAFNGMEAIDLLRKNPNQFNLIFLDWEMPVKDGPSTFAELKALGVTTPVFMLTTKNAPDDMMRMLKEGVTEYVLKPFTKDIIDEKIRMHLEY